MDTPNQTQKPNDAPAAGGEGASGTPPPAAPWYNSLPAELQTESVKKYGSLEDAVKGLNSAQELIGGKFPSDKTTPEFNSKFYAQLGRPEAPDKYDWKAPEGVSIDDGAFKAMREQMHGLGITNKQFKGILDLYAGNMQALQKQFDEHLAKSKTDSEAALKKDWGEKYDTNIGGVQTLLEKHGLKDVFAQSGLAYDERVIRLLHSVTDAGQEGSMKGSGTPADARAQIDALKKDPAYLNPNDPKHREVVGQVNTLLGAK